MKRRRRRRRRRRDDGTEPLANKNRLKLRRMSHRKKKGGKKPGINGSLESYHNLA